MIGIASQMVDDLYSGILWKIRNLITEMRAIPDAMWRNPV